LVKGSIKEIWRRKNVQDPEVRQGWSSYSFFQFQLSNHLPVAEPNKRPRLQQIMTELHTQGHNIHPRAIKCACRNFWL